MPYRKMGRIANLFIGLFIALAGYILTLVNGALGSSAAKSPLPFDVTLVLGYISTGFLAIGGILVGYSLVAGGYSIIRRIFGRKPPKEEEPEEGERDRREERGRRREPPERREQGQEGDFRQGGMKKDGRRPGRDEEKFGG